MEPNNFSDLIFLIPSPNTNLNAKWHGHMGKCADTARLHHYVAKTEKRQSVLISKKKKKWQ
jgi:hypothetical protein